MAYGGRQGSPLRHCSTKQHMLYVVLMRAALGVR
ncbi:hypothetical protein ACP4OV_027461 [Aristida adscensionis]